MACKPKVVEDVKSTPYPTICLPNLSTSHEVKGVFNRTSTMSVFVDTSSLALSSRPSPTSCSTEPPLPCPGRGKTSWVILYIPIFPERLFRLPEGIVPSAAV